MNKTFIYLFAFLSLTTTLSPELNIDQCDVLVRPESHDRIEILKTTLMNIAQEAIDTTKTDTECATKLFNTLHAAINYDDQFKHRDLSSSPEEYTFSDDLFEDAKTMQIVFDEQIIECHKKPTLTEYLGLNVLKTAPTKVSVCQGNCSTYFKPIIDNIQASLPSSETAAVTVASLLILACFYQLYVMAEKVNQYQGNHPIPG